jgi:hypothetical protein
MPARPPRAVRLDVARAERAPSKSIANPKTNVDYSALRKKIVARYRKTLAYLAK